jgi:ribosomal protein L21E
MHGLLALDLRRTAVTEITLPVPESTRLHKESGCNPAFVQRTLHAYATQYWIEGDLVRVKVGEMVGCTAKIDCVDMSTYSASAYMQESVHVENTSLKPLMFSLSDLERKFRVGDSVHVLDNSIAAPQLKGKTGMVVQVDEDTVVVLDQSSESEVSCLSTFISSLMFRQVHRWIRFFGDLHWEYKQTGSHEHFNLQ